jgi:hypothetical protein
MLGYAVVEETSAATDPKTWGSYDLVVASSGSDTSPVSSPAYRRSLIDFVAGDGRLLIEGGEIAYDAVSSPGYPNFADSVLHSDDWNGDDVGALTLIGSQADHPIAADPNTLPGTIAITYTGYGSEDATRPSGGAYAVYGTASYPADAGVLVCDSTGVGGSGQLVFFAFSYAAVSDRDVARNLLENTVMYFTYDLASVEDAAAVNPEIGLTTVSPNPFGSATVISFSLSRAEQVRLTVYDVQGRAVRTLVDGPLGAGVHQVVWDGREAGRGEIAPGIYFCRLTTAGTSRIRKLVKIN